MSDPLSWSSSLRVIAGLALVLVVFVLALRVLKRVQPGLGAGRADLRVVTSLALSPRERVLLVQVGEQQLLLGSSPQGLHCLHVLPQPLAPRTPSAAGSGPGGAPFADWLRQAMHVRSEAPTDSNRS